MKYFTFQWHITEKCDQRCLHCYIFSNKSFSVHEDMSLSCMKLVLENCIEMCEKIQRKTYFVITGGDPILHKDFWMLLELLYNKKIPFSILGNPFHLTEEVCEKLHKFGCQKYQLSLDGLETTHDSVRKKGSFRETLDKIPMIKAAGMQSVVMTTVLKDNIFEIPDIIDVVVEKKVDVFAFARYCPTSDDDSRMISPEEYKLLLERCWRKFEIYKESTTFFNLKDHLWTLFLYERGLFKIDDKLKKNVIFEGCNCASNHLTILPDGSVYACRRMESKVGNIFYDTLINIFNSSEMDKYRQYDKFEKCSKCELLRFCRGCPATTFAINNGNFYAPDPQCWMEI